MSRRDKLSSNFVHADCHGFSPDLSIVICTYRRPELLRIAARTSTQQELPDHRSYEVLIVDNCPNQSALPVINALKKELGENSPPLRYVHESRTNLSHARNAGIAASCGQYLVFVDDDMIVPPLWAANALETLEETDADLLIGDVEPVFPDGVSPATAELLAPLMWRRAYANEAGEVTVKANGHIPGSGTGNTVFRRETCFPNGEDWFKPAFGLSGGEDTDFLLRLGRRLPANSVWTCEGALMREFIPEERASKEYIVKRAYWGGQCYSRAVIENSRFPLLEKFRMRTTAMLQALWFGSQVFANRVIKGEAPLVLRQRCAGVFGKLSRVDVSKKSTPHR